MSCHVYLSDESVVATVAVVGVVGTSGSLSLVAFGTVDSVPVAGVAVFVVFAIVDFVVVDFNVGAPEALSVVSPIVFVSGISVIVPGVVEVATEGTLVATNNDFAL